MTTPWASARQDLGTIEHHAFIPIEGDFSDAVTLVATLTVRGFQPSGERLNRGGHASRATVSWGLWDSLDNEAWHHVEDTMGLLFRSFHDERQSGTGRFVVPFGPHLAVNLWVSNQGNATAKPLDDGVIEGAVLDLFWRRLV